MVALPFLPLETGLNISSLKCGTVVMFHMLFQAVQHNSSLTHMYVVLFAIFGIQLKQTQREI